MRDKIQIKQMKNGMVVGCLVVEISAIPRYSSIESNLGLAQKRIGQSFANLLQELNRFCEPEKAVFEILWVGKSVDNQTYKSKIQLFLLIRLAAQSEEVVKQRIETIYQNVKGHLDNSEFLHKVINADADELKKGLDKGTHPCMSAVVKAEQISLMTKSMLPHYSAGPFNSNLTTDFSMLIHTLSSLENGTISFQIIPSNISQQEEVIINEYYDELLKSKQGINGDAAAEIPLERIKPYCNIGRQGIYLYNILIMGPAETCVSLNAQICSLLKGISETDFSTINLTNIPIMPFEELCFYPWNINQLLVEKMRDKRFFMAYPLFKNLYRLPYVATISEVLSFFRLPIDDGKIKSIESSKVIKSKEQFSEKVVNVNNIQFGKLQINDINAPEIGCSPKAFTKHALIVGTPGSGKTTFSVYILLQFYKKNIPFLAIEPTKTEYRAMIDAIPELQIFTPGNNGVSPFVINPFIPPKGISVEQYVPSLVSAFKAAFSMPSPLDILFLKAIRESYSYYGWKDYSIAGDKDVTPFGIYEFILIFKRLVAESDYSKEVKGNMQSGGVLRLQNLIEQNSNIYDSVNTVPMEDLLSKPTVLELNAIDNAEQKSLLMALLLINICVYTKHNTKGDGELKNAILIDEAHVLLSPQSGQGDNNAASGTTIKALQDMIAEIRSYGTSIIVADQSPAAVGRAIVANTDIKIAFRLVQSDDKRIIADATSMDEVKVSRLGKLGVGEAFVYYNQLEEPQLVVTPDIRENERIRLSVSNTEIKERSTYWNGKENVLIPFRQCAYSDTCKKCDFAIRADAEYFANRFYSNFSKEIVSIQTLDKSLRIVEKWLLTQKIDSYSDSQIERLVACVKIRVFRKVLLNKNISVSEENQQKLFERCMKLKGEAKDNE